MSFADKLVFLINLTNSTNKKLADAINLDPSQISRLRCGARKLPRNAEYLPDMAAYFVERCHSDYQLITLSEQINGRPPNLPMDQTLLTEELRSWLEEEETLLTDLPPASGRCRFGQRADKDDRLLTTPIQSHSFKTFYGSKGQRQALEILLETTLRRDKPALLQFYSDQELAWQEEADYLHNIFPERLLELLQIGCRFQRILRPRPDLQYAFTSIKLWLPIHMKGGVESYFYPYLRDMVHRQTLIAVPQVGAIFSNCIGSQCEDRICYLVTEESLVRHYSREFNDLQKICQKIDTKYKEWGIEEYISNVIAMATDMDKENLMPLPSWYQHLSDQ